MVVGAPGVMRAAVVTDEIEGGLAGRPCARGGKPRVCYARGMQALGRIETVELFPEERAALLALLETLTREQWALPTVCAGWSVKDVAAHIVGDDIGVVARGRDGYTASWIDAPSYEALVAAINAQNEAWVAAMRRASPRQLIELLRFSGERLHAHFRSLDLDAVGGPVDWAGPGPQPVWMDVAREYTERWAHGQQIRDAIGAPMLASRRMFFPVLDAYARALPHAFRDVAVADGTHVRLVVTGEAGGEWSLVRTGGAWGLYSRVETPASATVTLPQDAAWRVFTKGIAFEDARRAAVIDGDSALGDQVLRTVAVLA
jgi:uncharacterized protein (TIGR03083 family)